MWVDIIPVGRMGSTADTGKAAAFIASDDPMFIVGTELISDGCMTNLSLMN